MSMKAHFEGLGMRDLVKDKDQIIWFLERLDKYDKRKAIHIAKFLWKEQEALMKCQAFELLAWLSKYDPEKREKRNARQRELKQQREEKKILYNMAWGNNHTLRIAKMPTNKN